MEVATGAIVSNSSIDKIYAVYCIRCCRSISQDSQVMDDGVCEGMMEEKGRSDGSGPLIRIGLSAKTSGPAARKRRGAPDTQIYLSSAALAR